MIIEVRKTVHMAKVERQHFKIGETFEVEFPEDGIKMQIKYYGNNCYKIINAVNGYGDNVYEEFKDYEIKITK